MQHQVLKPAQAGQQGGATARPAVQSALSVIQADLARLRYDLDAEIWAFTLTATQVAICSVKAAPQVPDLYTLAAVIVDGCTGAIPELGAAQTQLVVCSQRKGNMLAHSWEAAQARAAPETQLGFHGV